MVHDHVAPREEVLGDEGRAAGVRGEDGRPRGRGPVVAGMGASRLAVEEPPEPEAARRLAALDRGPERTAPQPLRRAGGERRPQLSALGLDPGERRRIEVDHPLRQRDRLRRERAGPDGHRPRRERAAVLRDARPGDSPAERAGPDVEVDADQRRDAVRRREQRERAPIPLPAHIGGRAGHLQEDHVARLRARRRHRHAQAAGRAAREGDRPVQRAGEQADRTDQAQQANRASQANQESTARQRSWTGTAARLADPAPHDGHVARRRGDGMPASHSGVGPGGC